MGVYLRAGSPLPNSQNDIPTQICFRFQFIKKMSKNKWIFENGVEDFLNHCSVFSLAERGQKAVNAVIIICIFISNIKVFDGLLRRK